MNNYESLMPCPFCGGTSLKVDTKTSYHQRLGYRYTASVRCNKCHARGPTTISNFYESEEQAIINWNYRQLDVEGLL